MGTQAAGGGPERGDSASVKGVPQCTPCEEEGKTTVHGEAGLHRPRNPQARGGGCHSRSLVRRVAGKPRCCAEERREGAHVCQLHQPQQSLPPGSIPAST